MKNELVYQSSVTISSIQLRAYEISPVNAKTEYFWAKQQKYEEKRSEINSHHKFFPLEIILLFKSCPLPTVLWVSQPAPRNVGPGHNTVSSFVVLYSMWDVETRPILTVVGGGGCVCVCEGSMYQSLHPSHTVRRRWALPPPPAHLSPSPPSVEPSVPAQPRPLHTLLPACRSKQENHHLRHSPIIKLFF